MEYTPIIPAMGGLRQEYHCGVQSQSGLQNELTASLNYKGRPRLKHEQPQNKVYMLEKLNFSFHSFYRKLKRLS